MRYLSLFLLSILVLGLFAAVANEAARESSNAIKAIPSHDAAKSAGGYSITKLRSETPIDIDDPVSCQITPNPASIEAGASLQFTARCYDTSGSEDACPGGEWSTNAGILFGNLTPSPTITFLIASETPMDGYIRYTDGYSPNYSRKIFSCTASVAVIGDADHVAMMPESATVQQGGTQRFFARLEDSAGHMLAPASWNWSLDGAIGAIEESTSDTTLFTAQNVGTGRIIAIAIPAEGRTAPGDEPGANPAITNIPTPARPVQSRYTGIAQITVTAAQPSSPGDGTGGSGAGGAGGDNYFDIKTSGQCANQTLEVTVTSGGRPAEGVTVKLYLDTGSLQLIEEETASSSGTVRFTPKETGKYLVRAISGSMQESTVVRISECGPSSLAPAEGGEISLEGAQTILLQKRLIWNSGFSKEVIVTRSGDDVSTKIIITFNPPSGAVPEGYEIIDTIPASIASRSSLVALQSAGTKLSESPLTYAFSPSRTGRTTLSYVIARQLTDEMAASLPEPKLQKSLTAESQVPSNQPGIADSILATMRGVKNFFTGSDIGMMLGILVGGLILIGAIYFVAFRGQKE